jgi:predicted nucleotidyltransferase
LGDDRMAAREAADAPPPGACLVRLSPIELAIVRGVVDAVLPGASVWIFGSRAAGSPRPWSDLDLLVEGKGPLTWAQRADLRDRFEASDLPFRVDVVDAASLEGVFGERVRAERVALRSARPG